MSSPHRRTVAELEAAFEQLRAALEERGLDVVRLELLRRFLAGLPPVEAEAFLLPLSEDLQALLEHADPAGWPPAAAADLADHLDRLAAASALLHDAGADAWARLAHRLAAAQQRTVVPVADARPAEPARPSGPFVPVLARLPDESSLGGLRVVEVRLRRSNKPADRIDGEVLPREPSTGTAEPRAWEGGRAVAEGLVPGVAGTHVTGTVRLRPVGVHHTGRSAELGVGAALVSGLVAAHAGRERYALRPGLALTGTLDAHGHVGGVEGIAAKTRAAFFAPVQALVVPHTQLEDAEAEVDRLRERYPERPLPVVGVATLAGVFADRRLTTHERDGVLRWAGRLAWRRRFSVWSLLLVLVIAGLAARLALGPFDRTPDHLAWEGSQLLVQNRLGETLDAIEVGARFVQSVREKPYRQQAALHDVNADGQPEVLWIDGYNLDPGDPYGAVLRCKTVGADTLLWSYAARRSLRYPGQPDVNTPAFNVVELAVGVLDVGGRPDGVVIANHIAAFPSLVARLDLATGEPVGTYTHVGHLTDMDVRDLDGDGIAEVLIVGKHQGFDEASVAVLDSRLLHGHVATPASYEPAGLPLAAERFYVRIPPTPVGRALRWERRGARALRVDYQPANPETNDAFKVYVQELSPLPGQRLQGWLLDQRNFGYYAQFDAAMRLRGVTTFDDWDLLAQRLVEEGALDAVPGTDFFDTLPDALHYWDGTAWVQGGPVVNQRWVAAVDSLARASDTDPGLAVGGAGLP